MAFLARRREYEGAGVMERKHSQTRGHEERTMLGVRLGVNPLRSVAPCCPCALRMVLACIGIATALGGTAFGQGVVKSKHGDWELRCETPPGAAREQCALLQSVAA